MSKAWQPLHLWCMILYCLISWHFLAFFPKQIIKYVAIDFNSEKLISLVPLLGFQINKCNYNFYKNVVQFLAQNVSRPFP